MTRATLARRRYKRMKAVYTIMNRYRRYKLRSYMINLIDTFRFVFSSSFLALQVGRGS
jgi:hypothetical protein